MDYLGTAQGLARRLPAEHRIKLHSGLCLRLRKKLNKTLEKIVESCRGDGGSECYREVLKELHRVVQKVKTFVDECCYDDDGEFTLAALRVTAHKERYFMYRVELHWCMFLVECVRDGYVHGERQFDWEGQKSTIVREDSSIIEDDERDLKASLELRIAEPGEHQAICWNLLRRLEADSESYNTLPDDLGMPPITSSRGRCVGRGGYGSVYEVNWEGKAFAVKEFEDSSCSKEVKILGDCCHPHIVNLILAHSQDGNQYLMMEKLSMDLHSYIGKRKSKGERFSALEVVDMISQVCEGMLYLNDTKSVSHRDVKPRNILVKESPYHPDDLDRLIGENRVTELQVADFGLAKVRENLEGKHSVSENTPNNGTPLYRAPELIQKPSRGRKIRMSSMKADIYSFAVTCSCLLTGTKPSGSNESVRLGLRPALPSDCPPGLSSLLQRCWHQKPSKRPKDFKQIRMELRKLKTDLLTAHAHRDKAKSSASVSAELDLKLTPEEVRRATRNFSDRNYVGVGSMSTVYRGVLPDATVVAVKRLGIQPGEINEAGEKVLDDGFAALAQVRDWTLVKVVGYCCSQDVKALVMEYMPNGTLGSLMYPPRDVEVVREFNWSHRFNAAISVAQGLKYLHHESRISTVHGDLKPSNVLFSTFMEARIAGFGVKRLLASHEFAVGASLTSGYTAPELAANPQGATIKGDVYSFGIIVLEMISGRSPQSLGAGQRLPQWIRATISNSKLLHHVLLHNVLDPILMSDLRVPQQTLGMVLGVALLCTRDDPQERPYITEVLKMLNHINTRPQDGSRRGSARRLRSSLSAHLLRVISPFLLCSHPS